MSNLIKPLCIRWCSYIQRCCIPWYTLYIWCCICRARGQLRQLQHWTALQPKWQGDAMGMEADSDALKWEKGVLEQMSECLQAFSVWREKESESRWNDEEFDKRTSMALFEHRFVWSNGQWQADPQVFGSLSYMLVSFYPWFSTELCSLSSSTVSTQSNPLCTQTFSTIHSFAV